MKTLFLFIAVSLALGAAALGAAYGMGDEAMLVQASVAFGLAFVPSVLSLAFVLFSYRAADVRLLASLGGSGFRMFIALGGGYFLTSTQPQAFTMDFWYWLLAFYLALLGFEIYLIIRQQSESSSLPPGGPVGAKSVPQS